MKKKTKNTKDLSITHRTPFLCLDSRWQVKWKWMFDIFAGPNEGYAGYIDAWDTVPWQKVKFDDGVVRDFNYAAQSQFIPKYSGDILGTRDDIIALLETDGIAGETITAAYSTGEAGVIAHVALCRLFFRNFDSSIIACPIVFSRPMTYKFGAPGHIGDNSEQAYFIRAEDSCDGTEGLHATLLERYRKEFWADAMHFSRSFEFQVPSSELPPTARLVVYTIACGSVPRICINGTWFHVSPLEHFPPYGDPYGYVFRGHKHTVGVISEIGLRTTAGETNEFIVEHLAIHGSQCGAQVIFVIEWDETIIEPIEEEKERRRRKMARPTVTDRIKQGYLIKNADNAAIANGDAWQILPGLRAEHDTAHTSLITSEATAQANKDNYHNAVKDKDKAEEIAGDCYQDLRSYIIAKYSKETVNAMLVALNIDVEIERDDDKAVARLFELMNRWVVYDGTPDEIPAAYKNDITAATMAFGNLITGVQAKETAMDQAMWERNAVMDVFVNVSKRIRTWLVSKLPEGRYDRRLQDYGFNPHEKPSYPIPEKVENLQGIWSQVDNRVELKWVAAEDATSYEIFRAVKPTDPNEKPAFVYHAATENLVYFDTEATPGLIYYYQVRGKNKWHDGEFSTELIVKCIA